jgi:hypothetical protein
VPRIERFVRLHRQLQERDLAIQREHIADLFPGELHVALLVRLDDARAHAGGRPKPWVGIELVDPVAVLGKRTHPLDERVPASVQRHADERILVGVSGHARLLHVGGKVHLRREVLG